MGHDNGQPSVTSAIGVTHMLVAAESCTAWSWKLDWGDQRPKKGQTHVQASWGQEGAVFALMEGNRNSIVYFIHLN